MSNTAWLFVALLAVWIGIGGYLVTVALRQRKLEGRLEDLEGRASDRRD